jgi:general L-amino acid transport system substrate-binding protein
MRPLLLALITLILADAGRPAAAGELDRVRTDGAVQCASDMKPGLAFPNNAEHKLYGIGLELCRAVANAVLGSTGKIRYRLINTPAEYAALRTSNDALFFLTVSEIIANHLQDAVLPGPPVLFRAQQVIVHADSDMHDMTDLQGRRVCAEPGTETERSLRTWLAEHHVQFIYLPFQEQQEMLDAFQVGRCEAMADDTLQLAAIRADAAHAGTRLRILPEALSLVPIYAATRNTDGAWATTVAWVIQSLIRADHGGADLHAGMMNSLNITAPALGLEAGWQARMLSATGSYAAIYNRTLGDASPLQLPRGPNQPREDGGLLVPPYAE